MGNARHLLPYGLSLVVALSVFISGVPEPLLSQEATSEKPTSQQVKVDDTILGAPPAFDLSGEESESLWVEAETRLYRQPARRSPVLTTFGSDIELPVLERRPGWVRIRFDSWRGWVSTEEEAPLELVEEELAAEELEMLAEELASDEPWWIPRVEADREHLKRARQFLSHERVAKFGAFQLYTDLEDDKLLSHLTRIAEQLPELFTRRFALETRVDESDTVVLFQSDKSYRAYIADGDNPIAEGSLGHAIGGLAVLAVGKRSHQEVRQLLIHELTHVLTYHALGPNLPAWLNEGMAEDLAYNRVNENGAVVLGSLDSWRSSASVPIRRSDGQTQFVITTTRGGPSASLDDLRRKWKEGRAPALESLVTMPSVEFMVADQRQLHYALSTFLVRYLLSAEDSSRRFRAFVQAVAGGSVGDEEELMTHLETNWGDLEPGFLSWLGRLKKKR